MLTHFLGLHYLLQLLHRSSSYSAADINLARNSLMLIIIKRENREYCKKFLCPLFIWFCCCCWSVIQILVLEPQDSCRKISFSFNRVGIVQVFLYPLDKCSTCHAFFLLHLFFSFPKSITLMARRWPARESHGFLQLVIVHKWLCLYENPVLDTSSLVLLLCLSDGSVCVHIILFSSNSYFETEVFSKAILILSYTLTLKSADVLFH